MKSSAKLSRSKPRSARKSVGRRVRKLRFGVLKGKVQYPNDLDAPLPALLAPLTYDQIAAAAMRLSPKERGDLADKLWISVDTPQAVAAAWDAEIARRIAQIDKGEAKSIPFEKVMADMRAILKRG